MGFWKKNQTNPQTNHGEESGDGTAIHQSLEINLKNLKEQFKDCDDIIYREIVIGDQKSTKAVLISVDGMIDKNLLNENVLSNVMLTIRMVDPREENGHRKLAQEIQAHSISVTEIKEVELLEKAILHILSGDAVLLVDDYDKAMAIGSKGWQGRGVSEPITEGVIRGPRDGFTETLRVNTALIRRRVKDTRLKLKGKIMGVRSKTDLAIFYMEDIVDPRILEEVKRRLSQIDIDAILDSGYIEQLIEDNWISPFPQIQNTERPDVAAAALYEGKVVLVVDNSPFALIMPATINSMMQSPEDYYERWNIGTAVRLIRYFAASISLVLPALYVAISSFHPQMLPTRLALAMAADRQNVPFPVIVEAIIMETTIELLREAGVRLPGPIGATIGIVGGLVIGQAAVEAGIAAPLMVIIVSVTAIASFSVPSYNLAIGFRLLRFGFILAGGFLGLYGITLGVLMVLIHLCELKSFSIPYLHPFVSGNNTSRSFKDTMVRAPWMRMKERDDVANHKQLNRLDDKRSENKNQEGK